MLLIVFVSQDALTNPAFLAVDKSKFAGLDDGGTTKEERKEQRRKKATGKGAAEKALVIQWFVILTVKKPLVLTK